MTGISVIRIVNLVSHVVIFELDTFKISNEYIKTNKSSLENFFESSIFFLTQHYEDKMRTHNQRIWTILSLCFRSTELCCLYLLECQDLRTLDFSSQPSRYKKGFRDPLRRRSGAIDVHQRSLGTVRVEHVCSGEFGKPVEEDVQKCRRKEIRTDRVVGLKGKSILCIPNTGWDY